jgi:hypothetical protein
MVIKQRFASWPNATTAGATTPASASASPGSAPSAYPERTIPREPGELADRSGAGLDPGHGRRVERGVRDGRVDQELMARDPDDQELIRDGGPDLPGQAPCSGRPGHVRVVECDQDGHRNRVDVRTGMRTGPGRPTS